MHAPAWLRPAAPAREYHWITESNFGDQMAPLLLKAFAGLDTIRDTISHSMIVTVGSVLEHVPPEWGGAILGAGKLREDSQLNLHNMTGLMLGVRGPLTARQCPAGTAALGDPGLLVSELIAMPDKIFDLGIIPHWSDAQLEHRPEFRGKWETRVISPRGDPLSVIAEIARCRRVVTSSLHGAVVADAFGIPRRVEPAGLRGTDRMFKWRDYSASIGVPFTPERMTEVSRLRIEDRRYELLDAYDALGAWVRAGYR